MPSGLLVLLSRPARLSTSSMERMACRASSSMSRNRAACCWLSWLAGSRSVSAMWLPGFGFGRELCGRQDRGGALVQFQQVGHDVAAFTDHEVQFVIDGVQVCGLLVLPLLEVFQGVERLFTAQFPAGVGNRQPGIFNLAVLLLPLGVVQAYVVHLPLLGKEDRKSTRLNSSHVRISYAVF